MRVLLVEDEAALRESVRDALADAGYAVDGAADGEEGLYFGLEYPADVAVVDLGLPKLNGIELIRRLRAQGRKYPILVLTARDRWQDKVEALGAGADDYLTKPFHPEELLLRIQALLRRAHGIANQPLLEAGGLALDEARQRCSKDGRDIELTAGEFRLLRYFMLHPGQFLSKTQLTEHLYDGETERDSNVIEVHVNRLRGKLGRELIETRRGQGYRFGGAL